jgi:hypothetical protein
MDLCLNIIVLSRAITKMVRNLEGGVGAIQFAYMPRQGRKIKGLFTNDIINILLTQMSCNLA